MINTLLVNVAGQGLHDITSQVRARVKKELAKGQPTAEQPTKEQLNEGLCTLYIQHTSASLLIQENYDASAKTDLENWLNRLVPEHDSIYTHTIEGPDDMPAHIKSALTATSLAIPVIDGDLALGTWQGVFLWEHRYREQTRKVIIHLA